MAEKIECENFANIFTSAINLLDGYSEYLGSWNDSPAYMAHKKGLSEEYETLSSELLKNVRLAILYAINEW